MSVDWFHSIPIIFVLLATIIFFFLFFEVGYQIGRYYQSHNEDKNNTIQLPVVAGLLAMLAFVLAFAFSMSASRFQLRKQNVLVEANIVSKAYLRADMVAEPFSTEVKSLLREYVDIRLLAVADKTKLKMAIARSLELHELLRTQAISAAKINPGRPHMLMVQSIHEIIEMHAKRVNAAIHDKAPGSIWFTLYVIAAFAMITLGSQAGLIQTRRLFQIIPTVLAFSVLITLVAELDRPGIGNIKVSQGTMIDLQKSMNKSKQ